MKNLAKLLTLLLAVALICGMLVLVTSAAEGDVAQVNGTPYPTLAAAIENAGAGDTVTLIANATVSDTIIVTKNVTIDLAGYELSSGASPVFTTDAETTLTIKGTGSIKTEGTLYAATTASAKPTFNVTGAANTAGIYIHYGATVMSDANNGLVTMLQGTANVKNASIHVAELSGFKSNDALFASDVVKVDGTDVSFIAEGANFNFDTVKISSNHMGGSANVYIAEAENKGKITFVNSSYVGPMSGFHAGLARQDSIDDVCVLFENSEFYNAGNVTQRAYFVDGMPNYGINEAVISTRGTILIKNSFASCAGRLICGSLATIDNGKVVVDNSTISVGGSTSNGNPAQQFFRGYAAYITNNSIIGSNIGFGIHGKFEDSNTKEVLGYHYVECVEVGTRASKNNVSGTYVKLPADTQWVYDPAGNFEYPWLLVNKADAANYKTPEFTLYTNMDDVRVNKSKVKDLGGASKVFPSMEKALFSNRLNNTGNQNNASEQNTWTKIQWDMKHGYLYAVVAANGNRFIEYTTTSLDMGTYVDSKGQTKKPDPYFVLGGGNQGNNADSKTYIRDIYDGDTKVATRRKVVVAEVDFGTTSPSGYTELNISAMARWGVSKGENNSNSLKLFLSHDGTVTTTLDKIEGSLADSEIKLNPHGQWNRITMVFYSDPSFADGIAYVYLNGQLVGTTFFFNHSKVSGGVAWDAAKTYVQGIRFNINYNQTYADNNIVFDNIALFAYDNYLGETEADGTAETAAVHNPALYVNQVANGRYINADYEVAGVQYTDINAALAAATALGTVAQLRGNVEIPVTVTTDGILVTNGYSIALSDESYAAKITEKDGKAVSYEFKEAYNSLTQEFYWLNLDATDITDPDQYTPTTVGVGKVAVAPWTFPAIVDPAAGTAKIHTGWYVEELLLEEGQTPVLWDGAPVSIFDAESETPIILTPAYETVNLTSYVLKNGVFESAQLTNAETYAAYQGLKDGQTLVLCADLYINKTTLFDNADDRYTGGVEIDNDYTAGELETLREASAKIAVDLNGYQMIANTTTRVNIARVYRNTTLSIYSSRPGARVYSMGLDNGPNGQRMFTTINSGGDKHAEAFTVYNAHIVLGTYGEYPGSNLTLEGGVILEGMYGDNSTTIEADGVLMISTYSTSTGAVMTRFFSGEIRVTNCTLLNPTRNSVIDMKSYYSKDNKPSDMKDETSGRVSGATNVYTPYVYFENCVILNNNANTAGIISNNGDGLGVCLVFKNVVTNGRLNPSNIGNYRVRIYENVASTNFGMDSSLLADAANTEIVKYNEALDLQAYNAGLIANDYVKVTVPDYWVGNTLYNRYQYYVEAGKRDTIPAEDLALADAYTKWIADGGKANEFVGTRVEIFELMNLKAGTVLKENAVSVTYAPIATYDAEEEEVVEPTVVRVKKGSKFNINWFIPADVEFGATKLTFEAYADAPEYVTEDVVVTPTMKLVANVNGVLANLSIYADFNINVFLPIAYKPYVNITVDGVALATVDVDMDNDGVADYIKVTVNKAPDKADENVVFTINVSENGANFTCTATVSIASYAEAILGGNYTAAEKQLMYYTAAYANEAYKYFGNTTENNETLAALLANYESAKGEYVADETYADAVEDTGLAGVFANATVDLGSAPKFVFTLKDGFAGTVTITYGHYSNTVTYTVTAEDSRTITLTGMKAYNFSTDIFVNAEGTIGGEAVKVENGTYNLDTFVKFHADNAATNEESAKVLALLKAFYDYCVVANAYKA